MNKCLCTLLFLCLSWEVQCQKKYILRQTENRYEDSSSDESPYYENEYKSHPYDFGYNVKDDKGQSHWHKEESDEYNHKKGTYGYTDAHGIYREVEYVADHNGFRAKIKTNEPGTASYHPAHVYMDSEPPPKHLYSLYQPKVSSEQYEDYEEQHPNVNDRYTTYVPVYRPRGEYSDE